MFEALVTQILNRVAGRFLVGFDPKSLSLGIWSGNVELRDLEVKGDALQDLLDLPIHVRKGYVRRIKLSIPWKELKSKPVVAHVSGVYVFVTPKTADEEPSEEEQREAAASRKMQQVLLAEAQGEPQGEMDASTTGALVSTIVDNLQVVVEDVHIRFEDATFAFGVTIERLSAVSTNSRWEEGFVGAAKVLHKIADLSRLSVYLDTGVSFSGSPDLAKALADSIPRHNNTPAHDFIIAPLSAQLRLKLKKSPKPDMVVPQIVAELSLQALQITLSEAQFHSVVNASARLAKYGTHSKYRALRPAVPISRGSAARKWWHYAYNSVLIDVREEARKRGWPYIMETQKDRRMYMKLYGAQESGATLTPRDAQALHSLEVKLSYENLRLYRALTRAAVKQKKDEKEKKKSKGMFGWMRSKGKTETPDSTDIRMTEDQRLALYELAGLDSAGKPLDRDDGAGGAPPHWVKTVATVNLGQLTVLLQADERPLCALKMTSAAVNFHQMSDSISVSAGLDGLEVINHWNSDTQFPKLLTVSQDESQVVHASLNTLPHGEDTLIKLKLSMASMDVTYDHNTVDRILSFFTLGAEEEVMLSGVGAEASRRYAMSMRETEANIARILDSRVPPVDLDLVVGTPTIIVPAEPRDRDAPVVVLVLGQLVMTSKYDESADRAFDLYSLRLRGIECIVAPSASAWHNAAERNTLRIIQPFDISLDMSLSAVPQDWTKDRVKVKGHLSLLDARVSTDTLRGMFVVVNSIIPATQPAPAISLPAVAKSNIEEIVGVIEGTKIHEDPELVLARANQVVASVSLSVDKVHLTVAGSRDLVVLNLAGMEASLTSRQNELRVDAVLSSVEAIDCMAMQDDFRQILSCSGPRLLKASFVMTTDSVLDVDASGVVVRLNRGIVADIVTLVAEVLPKVPKGSAAPVTPFSFRGNFKMHGVTAILNSGERGDSPKQLVEAVISGLGCSVDSCSDGSLDVKGSVKNIIVNDLSVAPESMYRQIVGPSASTVLDQQITFQYLQHTDGIMDIKAKVELLQAVFFMDFVNKIVVYFTEFSEMMAVDIPAPPSAISVDIVQTMRLDVSVASPVVIIPRAPNSTEVVVVELGSLKVTNKLESNVNRISSVLSGMNIRSDEARIMKEVNVSAEIVLSKSGVDITGSLSDARFILSVESYGRFMNVLFDNIVAGLPAQKQVEVPEIAAAAFDYTLNSSSVLYKPPPKLQFPENKEAASLRVRFSSSTLSVSLGSPPVVTLSLDQLSAGVHMWDNGALVVDVGLESLNAIDSRPDIPAHLRPILTTDEDEQLTLFFGTCAESGDSLLDVKLRKPIVTVVPSQVQFLLEFALSPFNQLPVTSVPPPPAHSMYIAASLDDPEVHLVDGLNAERMLILRASLAARYDMIAAETPAWQASAHVSDARMLIVDSGTDDYASGVSIVVPAKIDAEAAGDATGATQAIARLGGIDLSVSYRDLVCAMSVGNNLAGAIVAGLPKILESVTPSLPVVKKKRVVEEVYLISDIITVRVIDDCLGESQDMPVVEARVSQMQGRLTDWSTNFQIEAGLTTAVDYFNRDVTAWEPCLEPLRIEASLQVLIDGPMTVKLNAIETLNVNVTSSLVSGLIQTLSTWQEDFNVPDDRRGSSSRVAFSPFWIVNETGLDLECRETGKRGEWTKIPDQTRCPAPIAVRGRVQSHATPVVVDVLLDGSSDPVQVAINHTGVTICDIGAKRRVLFHITIRDGSYIVVVGSGALLKNRTTVAIDVSAEGGDQKQWVARGVQPGANIYLPIAVADLKPRVTFCRSSADGEGRFVLDTKRKDRRGWITLHQSDLKQIVWGEDDGGNKMYVAALLKAKPPTVGDGSYQVLTLSPSIVIENLLCSATKVKIVGTPSDFVIPVGAQVPVYDHGGAVDLSFNPVGFTSNSRVTIAPGDVEPQTVTVRDSKKNTMKLAVEMKYDEHGTQRVTIASFCWLRNATGLSLVFGEQDGFSTNAAPGQGSEESLNSSEWFKVFVDGSSDRRPQDLIPFQSNRVRIRAGDSEWSDKIPLSNPGTDGAILVSEKSRLHEIGVWIQMVDAQRSPTRLVTFVPRYILVNQSASTMLVAQTGVWLNPTKIPSGGRHAMTTWPDASADRFLSIKSECCRQCGAETAWSGGVDLCRVGELPLNIRCSGDHPTCMCRVEVRYTSGFVVMIVGDLLNEKSAPYAIENLSDVAITFGQRREAPRDRLEPGTRAVWGWDNPQGKLQIEMCHGDQKGTAVRPDALHSKKMLSAHGVDHPVVVLADGPTLVVTVSKCKTDEPKTPTSMFSSVMSAFGSTTEEKTEEEEFVFLPSKDINMLFSVSLAGLGVSLVDNVPQELLYASLRNATATLTIGTLETGVEFAIEGIQIDNQMADAEHEILLAPSTTRRGDMQALEASFVMSNEYKGVDYLKFFSIAVQPLDVRVSDHLLGPLLVAVNDIMVATTTSPSHSTALSLLPVPAATSGDIESKRVYCEMLVIQPVRVNLTFSVSSVESGLFGSLMRTVGTTMLNVENAPLRLNALVVENANAPADALINRIVAHYTRQALEEAYKVVGSVEFIGNPVSLVSNLGTGVMDFFVEPAQGAMESPRAFAEGLAKGTSSLLKRSIYGAFDAASKVTGSVSRGVAALTADDEYQRRRRRGDAPRHAGEGLLYGARDLGVGIFEGVTGIVTQPVRGAQDDGVAGFFKGLGRGIVGVATKPVAGVLDLATQTLGGIRNSTTVFDPVKTRVRPPRVLPRAGPMQRPVLRLYEREVAQGHHLVRRAGAVPGEAWVLHACVDGGSVLVLTTRRLICFDKDEDVDWDERIVNLDSVSLQGVDLGLKFKERAKLFGPKSRLVRVSDIKLAQWLERRLSKEIKKE